MLLLSFFFSGMEIAFISSSLLKIELKTAQGDRAAQLLSNFKKKSSQILITILIGNNFALVIFTLMVDSLSEPFIFNSLKIDPEEFYLTFTLIQSLIATLIILVFAEYIPKAIFRRNADRLIFPLAFVLNFFYIFFYIPVWVVNQVSKFLLRVFFRVTTDDRIVELGKKDLDHYVQELVAASETLPVEDLDTEMLSNALAFKDTKAREFMIPRTEIVAVSIDTSVSELIDQFIESSLSKIVVYEESLDQVVGYVHSNTLFSKPETIKQVLQSVIIVPETMSADVLLLEFTNEKKSIAIVVDEFGGTSGMVTMEDLVEEVFGEIEDEHDSEAENPDEPDLVKELLDDGTYRPGGRLEIDDINEEFELELPEEEYYTTLGGLVTYIAEEIPEVEASIEVGAYILTVEASSSTRVISILLRRKAD